MYLGTAPTVGAVPRFQVRNVLTTSPARLPTIDLSPAVAEPPLEATYMWKLLLAVNFVLITLLFSWPTEAARVLAIFQTTTKATPHTSPSRKDRVLSRWSY